jgi:valyl-tRNA synthetase
LTTKFTDTESLAKREAKRLERSVKAAVKQAASTLVHPRKDKKQKEKKEVVPDEEWINITPKGEKKGN